MRKKSIAKHRPGKFLRIERLQVVRALMPASPGEAHEMGVRHRRAT